MSGETLERAEPDAGAVLDQLERVVRWGDEFRLAFVKCNHPAQREVASAELLQRLADKKVLEINLEQPILSLLDEIKARWDPEAPPDAVCVYGLEKSINPKADYSPVLGRLNNDRDLLRQAVPAALLIWLPDFALDCVARGAPDFWAWRSGVYEFPTRRSLFLADAARRPTGDDVVLYSLTLSEKQQEIARLKELLRTARTLPKTGASECRALSRLLYQLGQLNQVVGNWNDARAYFRQSLEFLTLLGNNASARDGALGALLLRCMGSLEQERGNLTAAGNLYERSMQIEEAIGNKGGIGDTLEHLGGIAQDRGDLEQAEELYSRGLVLARDSGNKSGAATALYQLGCVSYAKGKLAEAGELYKECLRIDEEMGDMDGVAATLHQMGILEHDRGNSADAAQLYEQSLHMARKAGDQDGIARSLSQSGVLHREQGNLDEALNCFVEAWLLFEKLQSPYASLAKEDLLCVRAHIGEEQFRNRLNTAYGKQATQILKALDGEVSPPPPLPDSPEAQPGPG